MTQTEQTLASIRDHYVNAVQRGDRDRAQEMFRLYHRITGKSIAHAL